MFLEYFFHQPLNLITHILGLNLGMEVDCYCHNIDAVFCYSHTTLQTSVSSSVQNVKVKVKVTLVQALRLCTGRTAHRGSRGIALPFHDHVTIRGWGVSITPWLLFTRGKTRYPLYRRLGGPQGWSGQVQKIMSPPGFDSRTVQSVASCYTNYVAQPTSTECGTWELFYRQHLLGDKPQCYLQTYELLHLSVLSIISAYNKNKYIVGGWEQKCFSWVAGCGITLYLLPNAEYIRNQWTLHIPSFLQLN